MGQLHPERWGYSVQLIGGMWGKCCVLLKVTQMTMSDVELVCPGNMNRPATNSTDVPSISLLPTSLTSRGSAEFQPVHFGNSDASEPVNAFFRLQTKQSSSVSWGTHGTHCHYFLLQKLYVGTPTRRCHSETERRCSELEPCLNMGVASI